jgi:hypothetical protein
MDTELVKEDPVENDEIQADGKDKSINLKLPRGPVRSLC